MPISASDAINPALEHTKAQLLRPFRFGQWVRLALVGLLAGELGSSGGCNFHGTIPSSPPQHGDRTETFVPWNPHLPAWVVEHPWETVWLVIAVVVLFMAVVTVFLYIGSRMRFVLFDSVLARECHVRAGWRRRKEEGYRLFVWQILLSVISFLTMLFVIGVPLGTVWALGWLRRPNEHIWQLVLAALMAILVMIGVGIVFAVIHVLTKDFVVPQMALEPISALEGWRRLLSWMRGEKLGYAGYVGMKILLAVGAAIVIGLLSLIALLIVLIPAGLGIAAIIYSGKGAAWTWNLYTIGFASIGGVIFLAGVMFLLAFLNVPAIVFFPAYSIYFLAARYQKLGEIMWPPPPVQTAIPVAGLPPPPYPGSAD